MILMAAVLLPPTPASATCPSASSSHRRDPRRPVSSSQRRWTSTRAAAGCNGWQRYRAVRLHVVGVMGGGRSRSPCTALRSGSGRAGVPCWASRTVMRVLPHVRCGSGPGLGLRRERAYVSCVWFAGGTGRRGRTRACGLFFFGARLVSRGWAGLQFVSPSVLLGPPLLRFRALFLPLPVTVPPGRCFAALCRITLGTVTALIRGRWTPACRCATSLRNRTLWRRTICVGIAWPGARSVKNAHQNATAAQRPRSPLPRQLPTSVQ